MSDEIADPTPEPMAPEPMAPIDRPRVSRTKTVIGFVLTVAYVGLR